MSFIATQKRNNDPNDYSFVQVNSSESGFATIEDLTDAGLLGILGDMEENRLKYGD